MNSAELRELFLRFFEERGHRRIPSSPLVPKDDPTLLFTSAGMVQFKPYFLGQAAPPHPRLTSCQKCFRTTDIESIGDTKHLTFFEMLGNFSIGDYFKKEAIAWAWEFVTEYLKLPPERLWATVYLEDDEAFGYWVETGVPESRIRRFGEEDNFWGPAGDRGPCGPCSEIHYDFGEEYGCGRPDCGPNCDCPRFLEIWNLVFMQYNQAPDGTRTPLPRPNIDTGMGLERITAVMQGTLSVYDTDLFRPLIERLCGLAGYRYGSEEERDRAVRVVAEHSRGIAFLIADGVFPSNEDRGYVLRRLIRRARLFGHRLGFKGPFLDDIVDGVIEHMGGFYPELKRQREVILKFTRVEETRFLNTLERGLEILSGLLEEHRRAGRDVLPGRDIFLLYDTYGFPRELTAEIAAEAGFKLDLEGFETEMERQRERARARQKFALEAGPEIYRELGIAETPFVGYDRLEHPTSVVGMVVGGRPVERAEAGAEVEVVLAESPFYGEMGGQVGDTGAIWSPDGEVTVTDTRRPLPELIVHIGRVVSGFISVGDGVIARVDEERRRDTARNHTATHLLQAALRRVLGEHVYQQGSLVAPDRLRFDFSHPGAPSREELDRIQQLVNDYIRSNLPVTATILPYKEAIEKGAIALFGEKYGEEVRMVEVDGVSRELCGGTHVSNTGEIGFFYITSESSIGAGLRRIEAVTGRGAAALVSSRLAALEAISRRLRVSPEEAGARVETLLEELEEARKRNLSLERELRMREVRELREEVIGGVRAVIGRVSSLSRAELLGDLADHLRSRMASGVVLLATVVEDRPQFVAAVTPDLAAGGLHAGELVKAAAKVTGGGGGGRPEFARAGGRDKDKIEEALKEARSWLEARSGRG